MIKLFPHQEEAVRQLKTGSILCGGVGSGKTITALKYYSEQESSPALYVITTAAKRDTGDWEKEWSLFETGRPLVVDSWNNVDKYTRISGAFFIFDEQRVVGSGAWVKSFLKIVLSNDWILLSATPGDTWMDYIPAFIANGFYRNRSEFIREHVVYNTFTKYPKVDHYVVADKLKRLRDEITVMMPFEKKAISNYIRKNSSYDPDLIETVKQRWNPYTDKPIKDIGEFCYTMRKVVNSDPSRLSIVRLLQLEHKKIIVFYNFDYELELLRTLKTLTNVLVAEYNGHKHESVPTGNEWLYLVQYMSGAEGWNCIETNAIVFYSQNYSHRIMTQAAGRIDRLNTPFLNLYYYTIMSSAPIDVAIANSLKHKKDFNEKSLYYDWSR